MPNWTTAFFRLFSVLELMLLSATFTVEAGGIRQANPTSTCEAGRCRQEVSTQPIFWIYATFACALSSADAKTQLDFAVAGIVVFDRLGGGELKVAARGAWG